jgi:hypothetical protein
MAEREACAPALQFNRRVLVALDDTDRTVEKLRRQQAALAKFGRFAFNETDLLTILMEAARICAESF